MSAETEGWVWRNSPYRGSQLLVHLAIGDVVNDANGYEFWMSTAALAKKARVSRSTATATLADLIARDMLEMLESGASARKPSRYRFLMPPPASAVSGLVDMTGERASNATASAVSGLDMTGERSSTRPVSGHELKENSKELKNPRAVAVAPASKAKKDLREERGKVAAEMVENFVNRVKEKTRHRPPESDIALNGIIRQALADSFTRSEIGKALEEIQANRPRPVTKTTLWMAMQYPGGQKRGQGSQQGPPSAQDQIAKMHAVQSEIDRERKVGEAAIDRGFEPEHVYEACKVLRDRGEQAQTADALAVMLAELGYEPKGPDGDA